MKCVKNLLHAKISIFLQPTSIPQEVFSNIFCNTFLSLPLLSRFIGYTNVFIADDLNHTIKTRIVTPSSTHFKFTVHCIANMVRLLPNDKTAGLHPRFHLHINQIVYINIPVFKTSAYKGFLSSSTKRTGSIRLLILRFNFHNKGVSSK